MTAIWGPLGWMTLHSVSTMYPEAPTSAEQQLMATWLDMFRDTITCPSCRQHFGEMLATYKTVFPRFLQSRQEFALFVFRAHNTVNRRLNKPVYDTVEKCMEVLHNNVKVQTASVYRHAYLAHIQRFWKTMQDMSGIAALRKIVEMKKIENEYFSSHDTNFDVVLREETTLLPRGVLEKSSEEPRNPLIPRPAVNLSSIGGAGFRLTSQGLRLRK